ncbi:conserved protein of unknown function [Hyphomicrobium sp. 1Nfss2.1]
MRYHKAVAITKPEADHNMRSGGPSITDTVVLSHVDSWYPGALDAFMPDSSHAELAERNSRAYPPN